MTVRGFRFPSVQQADRNPGNASRDSVVSILKALFSHTPVAIMH
ncbi:hypothetical protein DSTSK_39820 [Desulforhabdus sp. TSK]|nr:hypothetical protein DSTSK_39820 [Desulforhabdus sp. TSK]